MKHKSKKKTKDLYLQYRTFIKAFAKTMDYIYLISCLAIYIYMLFLCINIYTLIRYIITCYLYTCGLHGSPKQGNLVRLIVLESFNGTGFGLKYGRIWVMWYHWICSWEELLLLSGVPLSGYDLLQAKTLFASRFLHNLNYRNV